MPTIDEKIAEIEEQAKKKIKQLKAKKELLESRKVQALIAPAKVAYFGD